MNSNVRRDALVSCISQLNPQAIVVGASLCQALIEAGAVPASFPTDRDMVIFPPTPTADGNPNHEWGSTDLTDKLKFSPLEESLKTSSAASPPPPSKESKITDVLIYVFTSGTTGLPKVNPNPVLLACAT